VTNLYAIVRIEAIDEFAQEVVDHDGRGIIEHRQRA
jgi:hypothetical protein